MLVFMKIYLIFFTVNIFMKLLIFIFKAFKNNLNFELIIKLINITVVCLLSILFYKNILIFYFFSFFLIFFYLYYFIDVLLNCLYLYINKKNILIQQLLINYNIYILSFSFIIYFSILLDFHINNIIVYYILLLIYLYYNNYTEEVFEHAILNKKENNELFENLLIIINFILYFCILVLIYINFRFISYFLIFCYFFFFGTSILYVNYKNFNQIIFQLILLYLCINFSA